MTFILILCKVGMLIIKTGVFNFFFLLTWIQFYSLGLQRNMVGRAFLSLVNGYPFNESHGN